MIRESSREKTLDFISLRGGSPETMRDEETGDKPRNAASYCAQFGIPIEDVEADLRECNSHREMLARCNAWLKSEDFRAASLELKTRPLETDRMRRERTGDTSAPATVQGFSTPASAVGKADIANQRHFFGCEDWSDEDLDGFVEMLETFPGGDWLQGHPTDTRRVYAMSCIALKEKAPEEYRRLIVHGEAWIHYG